MKPTYREFRVGHGEECSDNPSLMPLNRSSIRLALYFLGGECILWRRLDETPDGLWVLQGKNVTDYPPFKFNGKVTQIVSRKNGNDTILAHSESGLASIPYIVPMFLGGGRTRSTAFENRMAHAQNILRQASALGVAFGKGHWANIRLAGFSCS